MAPDGRLMGQHQARRIPRRLAIDAAMRRTIKLAAGASQLLHLPSRSAHKVLKRIARAGVRHLLLDGGPGLITSFIPDNQEE